MAIFGNIYNYFDGKKAHSLKINTLANFFGNAWTALIGIIFVPINLYYLGIEAYSTIGCYL